MIDHACCRRGPAARPGTFRLLFHFKKWFSPGAVLLLIPKCPLCIAASVAMFSGIGLSVSTASGLRIFLIVSSLAGLAYFSIRSYLKGRHIPPLTYYK